MRRSAKTKASAIRLPAESIAPADARRGFPAWIEADDAPVAFPAKVVTPRIRDGLVLRTVSRKKTSRGKGTRHGKNPR